MKRKLFLVSTSILSIVLLTTIFATTHAASFISVISGPTWGNDGPYTATICTNTVIDENVQVQTTTDGSALTGNQNTNPYTDASWNGTVAPCSFDEFEPVSCGGTGSGEGTWVCTFADTPNATINYRYIVTNQSGDWYELQTGGSFATGPLAVSLQSFTGETSAALPALFVISMLLLLGSTLFIWQRKRQ